MESFTQWERFITPTVIKILYWIAMVVVVIGGLVMFVTGLVKLSGLMIVQGILMAILGPIAVRIYTELIFLGFKVYDVLVEIRDKGISQPAS